MNEDKNMQYAESLARMIRCETVSFKGQTDLSKFRVLQAEMEQLFPHVFRQCEREDFDGSLLLRWKGSDSSLPPTMFMNHQDVVEANGEWTHPPFAGEIADGKLWGRGTLDTKGGLWAMLQAAEELMAEGYVPEHDIYFEAACTEEINGTGAKMIAEELKKRGLRFSLILDEGGDILEEPIAGAKGTYAMIGVGEKATVDLRFIARSHGGHASTPGKNTPLVRLGKFMAAVEHNDPFRAQMPDPIREMLERLSAGMSGPLKKACANAGKFAPLLSKAIPAVSPVAGAMFKTTIAFTMASGSDGCNVLPSTAWVVGNMRCAHHQDNVESIALITKMAKKYDLEVEIIDPGLMSPLTDYRGPAFARVAEAVQAIYPQVTPTPYIMTGGSDNRFFGDLSDGCIRFAPFLISSKQLGGIHGVDENIDISALGPGVAFYRHLMQNS